MIKPYPESDLSMNIMVLGSEIIKIFDRKNDFIIIENVMDIFLKEDLRRTPDAFIDAITLLFALDLIEIKGYKIRLKKNDITQQDLFRDQII